MQDSIARQRQKNKMLDRWENEGGKIAADATTSNDTKLTNANKSNGKKLSSERDNSTVGAPASPTRRRKP